MSWIPSFKIGLWNAWLLMLVFVLHPLILVVVDKTIGNGRILQKMGDVPIDKREKRDNTITTGILFILIVYSIFLPLKSGTIWFFAGLATWLAGLVMFLIAIINVATTPIGHVFKKGIYRYSRHPLYFSWSVMFLGVSVASVSWIFFLLSVVYILLQNSQAIVEERTCLKIYGDAYRDYMNKTPKWIGKPKSG